MNSREQQSKKKLRVTGSIPVKICHDSRRIGKPSTGQSRKPVIIYLRSPKVIHAQPQDFMALVQRLTGSSLTRSRYRENVFQNEAAVKVLRPSAPAPVSHQSIGNSSFDENVNGISPSARDDDRESEMGNNNLFQLEWDDPRSAVAHFRSFVSSPRLDVTDSDAVSTDLSVFSSSNIEFFNSLQDAMGVVNGPSFGL